VIRSRRSFPVVAFLAGLTSSPAILLVVAATAAAGIAPVVAVSLAVALYVAAFVMIWLRWPVQVSSRREGGTP
jgi:hypothetical protein